MKLRHIIILQNKIDLVKEAQAKEQYEQIIKFVQGTVAEKAPVIPISAQLKYNIEAICEYLVKKVPVPLRDFTSKPKLIIIRSFDVNKPGCEVDDLKGGVAGGSIIRGVLTVNYQQYFKAFIKLNSKFFLVGGINTFFCNFFSMLFILKWRVSFMIEYLSDIFIYPIQF